MNKQVQIWIKLLRISLGVIYLWFGVLKFFSGVSPAEALAQNTIELLTFHWIDNNTSLLLLAIWESLVGILLIAGIFQRVVIKAAFVHLIFTFTPLILLPATSFTAAPFSLTLVGQYIIKNLVLISSLGLLHSVSTSTEGKMIVSKS